MIECDIPEDYGECILRWTLWSIAGDVRFGPCLRYRIEIVEL